MNYSMKRPGSRKRFVAPMIFDGMTAALVELWVHHILSEQR